MEIVIAELINEFDLSIRRCSKPFRPNFDPKYRKTLHSKCTPSPHELGSKFGTKQIHNCGPAFPLAAANGKGLLRAKISACVCVCACVREDYLAVPHYSPQTHSSLSPSGSILVWLFRLMMFSPPPKVMNFSVLCSWCRSFFGLCLHHHILSS